MTREIDALELFSGGLVSALAMELQKAETTLQQRYPGLSAQAIREEMFRITTALNGDSNRVADAVTIVSVFDAKFSGTV